MKGFNNLKFLKKPSDIPTMIRVIAYGQKSYECKLCGVWGPWRDRQWHKCVRGTE